MTGALPSALRIDDPADPRIAGFVSIRERDLTGRQGRFIAEGTVVLRMLAAAHQAGRGFAAEAILLLENRLDGVQDILQRFPPSVPVYVANAEVFDAIAGFNMHRGVLALGRRDGEPDRDALIASLPASSLVLAACGISNHDNMGSLFRNAAAFGVDAVLMDETSCDPTYRKSIRVSVGSVLTVPFAREGSVVTLIERLQLAGFAIWGLSPSGNTDISAIPPAPRTALLMGTEGEGLPQSILTSVRTARIRQRAGLDSLNVSTAAGIALHQVALINDRI
ncbi:MULTISPECIES: RNA methyltransferase [unclassified Ensifer]|uniref:TrmH family RNA methyltransferase n=1 Tax=unclassified Ensifer TaxID=2633371 RepID=UPI000813B4B8|nr:MULTISPECIES: RNA methyltransferase [unclassified Ensifer]OCP08023.1 RNA methyltransferase [Ensifer sp. LC14]OCP10867.1 RNA methyltransferase [Ensifer sp. LC13]OCP11588.1 RNA methyltransferase [Ensifer sp. LC11]OCP33406.1 RNA methyltransferase [Ensifer sp. LC499]